MPLIKSSSRAAVSRNIRQLRSDRYPQKQAVAIALSIARRNRGKADGGAVDPLTGVTEPSDAAQGKFGRITDAILNGARNWIETPGRAMREGITTAQAADWAAPTAMGMVAGARLPGGAPEGALGSSGAKLAQPEGIRAYHGSPYDFDRFDASKIGTGEGAQAYGHGLYFAENEGVARQYRDTLGGRGNTYVAGKQLPNRPAGNADLQAKQFIETAARKQGVEDVPAEAMRLALAWRDHMAGPRGGKMGLQSAEDVLRTLENWQAKGLKTPQPGRMYEVNIGAKPEQFLDYDRPIAAQAPQIREVFDRFGYAPKDAPPFMLNDAANQLAAREGSWSTAAGGRNVSEKLREAGIPGIRYLDQGSRGQKDWVARHPQGGTWAYPTEQEARAFISKNPDYALEAPKQSSNYVVFDPGIVDILRKYGLAGGAAGLGAAASQKDSGMRHGGAIARARKLADGGVAAPPFYARSAARNLERAGMIHSPVAGRTDQLPMNVKSGSYVVPADVVSGIGQGNSLAGANGLNQLFKTAPGGAAMPRMSGGIKMPTSGMMKGRRGFADGGNIPQSSSDAIRRALVDTLYGQQAFGGQAVQPQSGSVSPFVLPDMSFGVDSGAYGKPQMRGGINVPVGDHDVGVSGSYKADALAPEWSVMGRLSRRFADGGSPDDAVGAPVDIVTAGGEFIVPVEKVAEIGGGSIDRGHDILDGMVSHIRKKTIKTLRKLPKPRKS